MTDNIKAFSEHKKLKRAQRQLVRRTQRDWMQNKFRESDKGIGVPPEDKPIPHEKELDANSQNRAENNLNDTIDRVVYGSSRLYVEPDMITCGVCHEDVYPQYTRVINKVTTCRRCDVMNINNISQQLKMGDWSYYGA